MKLKAFFSAIIIFIVNISLPDSTYALEKQIISNNLFKDGLVSLEPNQYEFDLNQSFLLWTKAMEHANKGRYIRAVYLLKGVKSKDVKFLGAEKHLIEYLGKAKAQGLNYEVEVSKYYDKYKSALSLLENESYEDGIKALENISEKSPFFDRAQNALFRWRNRGIFLYSLPTFGYGDNIQHKRFIVYNLSVGATSSFFSSPVLELEPTISAGLHYFFHPYYGVGIQPEFNTFGHMLLPLVLTFRTEPDNLIFGMQMNTSAGIGTNLAQGTIVFTGDANMGFRVSEYSEFFFGLKGHLIDNSGENTGSLLTVGTYAGYRF